jgi:predicted phosphohydrolase
MKIFAISDLHLSFETEKPMDIFGDNWTGYEQKIRDDWNAKLGADDVGIIAGDLSWAMRMEEAKKDFEFIKSLNGKKIVIRGNHDYWWKSISKIRETFAPDTFALQNDAVQVGDFVFAGTRGWRVPERRFVQSDEDKKIYNREVIRFELALKDAQAKSIAGGGLHIIAILHYPPFNATIDPSPFTDLCERFGVRACVYGHLHGKQGRHQLVTQKGGVTYYLTSCDLLKHSVAEIKI